MVPGQGGAAPEEAIPEQHAAEQGAELIGYRGPTACAAAGITYRQLDYWARTGLVEPTVRAAVVHLRGCGEADLSGITLMSDGASVYQCTSPDQLVALLQGGQGVFGIALGAVWRELETSLGRLHGERADTGETLVGYDPGDELARRRNRAG